ncbi:MAG: c-type cytochrome [Roseiflexaceae bacterium]
MKPLHYAMVALMIFVGVLVGIDGVNRQNIASFQQRAPNNEASDGRTLYMRSCAVCHGVNLEGQANWQTARPDGSYPAPPHDASGHTWHHPDAYLVAVTLQGGAAITGNPQNAMPGFAQQLTPVQAQAIIDYIKSTWPADIQAQQASLNK